MKNIFIPSGTLTYFGTYEALANMLYGLNGKLDNNGKYHGKVSVPGRNRNRGISFVRVRGKMSFIFRGNVEAFGDAYKIAYRVYPSFSSSLFLLLPVCILADQFITLADTRWQYATETLCAAGILSVFLIGLFWVARYFAIRRFVKMIEENEKEYEGIFD